MANELKHASVGTELTQAEWESITAHVLDAQATGDTIYASSATQLRRLGIGASHTVLAVSGGIPAWVAGPTFGATTTIQGNLVIDLGGQTLTLTHGIAASHQLTFPDPLGDDSFVYLALAQTLSSKTLNAPVMQGVWTASGTVTLPAFTTGGDIILGTNRIKGTGVFLKEHPTDTNAFCTRNLTDDAVMDFYARQLFFNNLVGVSGGETLDTKGATDAYVVGRAQDTGVGLKEIIRWVSGADPFIRIGRDDTGVALNAVTDMLVLQAGGGTGNEAAGFGLGISFKLGNAASQVEERASDDIVLVTATDGAEDVRRDWNLMAGGAMNLAMQLSGLGVLDVDASTGLGAATVGLFDKYDDAILLRQGISQRQLEVLERIGVMKRKRTGSGWMLNVQAMLYLLAGGIYQTREKLDLLAQRFEQAEKPLTGGI